MPRRRQPQVVRSSPGVATDVPAAPLADVDPGTTIASTLGLAGMALLPLAGGGYGGAGYLIALVLLPLCAAIAWPRLRHRAWLAQMVLLAYALSAVGLPFMLQEGR